MPLCVLMGAQVEKSSDIRGRGIFPAAFSFICPASGRRRAHHRDAMSWLCDTLKMGRILCRSYYYKKLVLRPKEYTGFVHTYSESSTVFNMELKILLCL